MKKSELEKEVKRLGSIIDNHILEDFDNKRSIESYKKIVYGMKTKEENYQKVIEELNQSKTSIYENEELTSRVIDADCRVEALESSIVELVLMLSKV